MVKLAVALLLALAADTAQADGDGGRRLLQRTQPPPSPPPWFVTGGGTSGSSSGSSSTYGVLPWSATVGLVDPTTTLLIVNDQRARHGSPPLTWDWSLASSAQVWADRCTFMHSEVGRGVIGENLGVHQDYLSSLTTWYDWEVCLYDWARPGLQEPAGHFTQAIWYGTTKIGCAVGNCPSGVSDGSGGGKLPGVFTVCHYSPPGNVDYGDGTFAKNVLPLQSWAPNPCLGRK